MVEYSLPLEMLEGEDMVQLIVQYSSPGSRQLLVGPVATSAGQDKLFGEARIRCFLSSTNPEEATQNAHTVNSPYHDVIEYRPSAAFRREEIGESRSRGNRAWVPGLRMQ